MRVIKTSNGEFAVSAPNMGFSDDFLKIDSTGDVLWAKRIEMYVADVVETADNGFLIVGNGPIVGPKFAEKYDKHIGVLKTDSLGQNSAECIRDIAVTAESDTIISQALLFTSEEVAVSASQPELQLNLISFTVESGCVDYVGAVNENDFSSSIQIFPNPSTGIFTIQTTNGEQLTVLEVYNAFGERVYQSSEIKSTELTVDLSGISAGMYFLKLTINERIYSRKVVLK